ncbi:MAG: nitroreductase [bacterium]|nr:nitroreductase [bacterium]
MRSQPLAHPPVDQAIRERRSFRAYKDQPVPKEVVQRILDTAKHTPSSTNMQPWRVFVVMGSKKAELDQLLLKAFDERRPAAPQMSAYLTEWFEPYYTRRYECGMSLYDTLNIDKDDKAARIAQSRKNFEAFGAPVAMFFAMDDRLKDGSLFDCGMFYQSVMLAALGEGLETCPEASLISWPDLLREFFGVGEELRFLSGMALGYADYQERVNQYEIPRAPVDEFTLWVDGSN